MAAADFPQLEEFGYASRSESVPKAPTWAPGSLAVVPERLATCTGRGRKPGYCAAHYPTSELSIDHVKPRSLGGGDSWENLVCACIRCNARKGGRTPEQARMKLIRKPVMPKRNPLIALRLGQDKYSSWKAFLDNAYWSVELK